MKRYSKTTLALVGSGIIGLPAAQGATFASTDPATPIPDGSPSGLASVLTISSPITSIQSITATLEIGGTFNGDLYAYLTHGSGFAVLLNRSGRSAQTGLASFGYDDEGFDVVFNDLASTDIHNYQSDVVPAPGSPLTGVWMPDGREIDPDDVLDTDPRTAMLDSFVGEDVNGDWTLFVADLASGNDHILNSWSITIEGIPEPAGGALLGAGLLGLLLRRRRS